MARAPQDDLHYVDKCVGFCGVVAVIHCQLRGDDRTDRRR